MFLTTIFLHTWPFFNLKQPLWVLHSFFFNWAKLGLFWLWQTVNVIIGKHRTYITFTFVTSGLLTLPFF